MRFLIITIIIYCFLVAWIFDAFGGEINTVAAVLVLEAGGERAPHTMEAVANVIYNRSRKSGRTMEYEALKPKQFSCMNGDRGAAIARAMKHPRYQEAVTICDHIRSQYDYTKGATFYHSNSVKPYWAKRFKYTTTVGNHIYYKTS